MAKIQFLLQPLIILINAQLLPFTQVSDPRNTKFEPPRNQRAPNSKPKQKIGKNRSKIKNPRYQNLGLLQNPKRACYKRLGPRIVRETTVFLPRKQCHTSHTSVGQGETKGDNRSESDSRKASKRRRKERKSNFGLFPGGTHFPIRIHEAGDIRLLTRCKQLHHPFPKYILHEKLVMHMLSRYKSKDRWLDMIVFLFQSIPLNSTLKHCLLIPFFTHIYYATEPFSSEQMSKGHLSTDQHPVEDNAGTNEQAFEQFVPKPTLVEETIRSGGF